MKALSGFYYVDTGDGELITCRARGNFRQDGMSPLVRKNCDVTVHIPMKGRITSLNASAAASILLYEAVRQRLSK